MKNDKIKELLNKLKELDIGLYEKYNKIYLNQNKPKSIGKWSVGTYVLFIKDLMHVKAGYIDVINKSLDKSGCICLEKYLTLDTDREKQNMVKWFATKSEAEKFAKTLVEPVKCGNGILDAVEPKQPSKQAVHCKTQEEWDFVTKKLNYKWNNETGTNNTWSNYGNKTFINLSEKHFNSIESKNYNFQILSFQEWCDLNGYKMEKEVKFEVGKWYICLCNKNLYKCSGNSDTNFYHSEAINPTNKRVSNIEPGLNKTNSTDALIEYFNSNKLASIEEIQQYLPDNHVDKIIPVIQQTKDMQSEFKVGEYVICCGNIYEYLKPQICRLTSAGESITDCRGKFKFSRNNNEESESVWLKNYVRHATPEEINNHLISIGQIPAGEPLNSCLEPNKDGMFKYTTGNSYDKDFSTSIVPGPLKMTLSIDDEELPMINIIKTKTVNLLNLE